MDMVEESLPFVICGCVIDLTVPGLRVVPEAVVVSVIIGGTIVPESVVPGTLGAEIVVRGILVLEITVFGKFRSHCKQNGGSANAASHLDGKRRLTRSNLLSQTSICSLTIYMS